MFKKDPVTGYWYEKKNGNLYVRETKDQQGEMYAVLLVDKDSPHFDHLMELKYKL